jgi:molybdopterin molybdotransferase
MRAGEDLPAVGPRREFLRGVLDDGVVRLAGSQDSSALSALAAADCLIDRPAGAPAVQAGEAVPVFYLQNG